jgi:GDP-L-fucose synthase
MPTNPFMEPTTISIEFSHRFTAMQVMRQKKTAMQQFWEAERPRENFVDDTGCCICIRKQNRQITATNVEDLTIDSRNHPKNNGTPREDIWDATKPDVVPQEINGYPDACIGWKHQVGLEEGIQKTYDWF